MDNPPNPSPTPAEPAGGDFDDDDDQPAVDMDEFVESGLLDDEDAENVVDVRKLKIDDGVSAGASKDAEIVQTRAYDLHMTYDKYYQTPRLWLFGYDEVSTNRYASKANSSQVN